MYIYGKNVIREKLNGDDKIIRAYLSNRFSDKEIINKLRDRRVRINFVDNKVLNSKVDGNHQGIILEIDDIKTWDIDCFLESIRDKKNPRVVILDHLEDPHNLGAIVRTSEALGVDGVIIPNDRSVHVNGTVIKTSAGAIEYIKIIRVANLQACVKKLKDNGFWIVGTDMVGEDYRNINYDMPVGLIIGNEGKGMSKVLKNSCDFIASIPMMGKINSLNASVSCAIILSEMV